MAEQIHYDLSKRILMIILIFTCAVFGVFLCVLGFAPQNGADLVQTSNNDIDYSVILKENDYFKEAVLPAGKTYIASLIDGLDIKYHTNLSFSQPVTGEYSYRIVATISADENKGAGAASYWSRDYELFRSESETLAKTKKLDFSRSIEVNYDEYNDMLRQFKQKYSLSASGKLKITFILSGDLKTESIAGSMPLKSEMDISVPLTQQAVEVSVNEKTKNTNIVLASSQKISETILLTCRIIGLVLVASAFVAGYASRYVGRIKEANEEFQINIKKLLASYDSIIVDLRATPNLAGLKISEVKDFDELLDVYNSVHMPINHYSSKNTSTFVIIDDGMAWKYVVRLSDYK